MPTVFSTFVEQLRRNHPRCSEIELASKPIGGTVRTYGGAGPNHFDGGVLALHPKLTSAPSTDTWSTQSGLPSSTCTCSVPSIGTCDS